MSSSGQKSGKALDRANFVNLLSQFLKEKRNLGDISVRMASKPESKGLETSRQAATMNFLPNMDNSSESSKPNLVESTSNAKSSGFSQMTIFFGGQVIVFNELPTEKFKEIMDLLSSHGCSNACSGVRVVADSGMKNKIDKVESRNPEIPDLNVATTTGNTPPPPRDPSVERCQHGGGSDLRIARRNSLHKFFEKRKDRAAAKAPYQVINQRGSPAPAKPDESKSYPEKGQSSKEASRDLDLKL